MTSALSAPYFHDEAAAFAELEATLWPHGPVCPRCGGLDRITPVNGARIGLRRCGPCKRQFTVTVGTVFESSHLPLNLWLQAVYLMCRGKKGISSHQLMRTLGVQYKTAWFMTYRIREAIATGKLPPMGGLGAVVEIDETFIGTKEGAEVKRGFRQKNAILPLVERGGNARSFHANGTSAKDLPPFIRPNVHPDSIVMTDEVVQYTRPSKHLIAHGTTNHGAGEYVEYAMSGGFIHSSTVEGYYSVFKRGMRGVYQHCAEKHLHRYVAEFDFRYNNRARLGVDDLSRTGNALRGIVGKRPIYRDSSSGAA